MTSAEEEVAAARTAATSSFVPAAQANVEDSPWATRNAGYSTWLAPVDTDGTWWQMLRPGAQGYGLMVCFHHMFICCNPPHAQGFATRDNDGVPLLFPALVHWTSVIDPATGLLFPDILRDYDQDLDFPPVGIANTWFLDDGMLMGWANLIAADDAMPDDWNSVEGIAEPLLGLAPPWCILPITEQAMELARPYLASHANQYGAEILGITNCELVGQDDDWFLENHSTEHCEFVLGWDTCSCGEPPTAVQLFVALVEGLVEGKYDIGDLFIPPPLRPAWDLALRLYVRGWAAVRARYELGDAWSSFCWQRLSPFSDSLSLVLLLRRLLSPSTTSATPPGSSPGSSQQLTLYGT